MGRSSYDHPAAWRARRAAAGGGSTAHLIAAGAGRARQRAAL